MTIHLLPLAAPLLLLIAAIANFSARGARPLGRLRLAETLAFVAVLVAVVCVALLATAGPMTAGSGMFAIRLDIVSLTMLALVSFVGWIVTRYSRSYLDGEARQGAFCGWLAMTLACVMLLVTAGNLILFAGAWIATSLSLHRLLLFYPERPAAQRAARKKFITARLADAALIGAFALLAGRAGSIDIMTITDAARTGALGGYGIAAAALMALAAVLKSAQFPLHGWLTEMMETPTPVSALLHAGVVNAGGFLLIRFADVMLLSPGVLAALVVIGGMTALFGGLVMLTQPAVKTSLAWSTVAQMGFMMMQCGLALFPLALLHIVMHSLYKAHAFLSSGGAIERIAAFRRPGRVAVPGPKAVAHAFISSFAIYLLFGLPFGFQHASPQAIALGAILICGVAYLLAQGLADDAPQELTNRTALYALGVSAGYFALHYAASALTTGTLPPTPQPGPLEWALMALALLSFGLVAVAQAMFPLWAYHPAAAGLRTHLANGLYANALFDRMLGVWSTRGRA